MSGSPFQTFYLMFKSNASQAKKDMNDLADTSDKTKKKIKDTKEEAVDLGKAFTNAVEDATRALAAYVSFQAIKTGIVNAQEFNRTLTIQSKLWGQNANEVAAYGAAVKAAGGDAQSLFGWYDQLRQQNAAQGRGTLPVGQLLRQIHGQIRGLSPEAAQQIFSLYGLQGNTGVQNLVSQSDENFNRAVTGAEDLTKNTVAGSEAAQKFGTSWDNLTTSLTKFWTTVNSTILPPLGKLIDALTYLFDTVADNKSAAIVLFAGITTAGIAFAAAAPSIIGGILGIGTAAAGAAGTLAGFLALLLRVTRIGGIVAGVAAVDKGTEHAASWAVRGINRVLGIGDKNGNTPGSLYHANGNKSSGTSSLDFWISKGYSREQAAGLVANEQRESGGNAGARGDNGSAVGLFQWHPNRVQAILAGTGIDVRTAGHDQQLSAAAWELQQMGLADKLRGISSASDAAAFVSSRFERPANGAFEALARGQLALQIAGQTPFASQSSLGGLSPAGGMNVSIGKIDVNTQATDAGGIAQDIISNLHTQIRTIFAQNNDAVAY